jgi:HK97 gp10 family phage protein
MPDINVTVKPSFEEIGKAMSSVDIKSFLRGEINKIALLVERYGKQLAPVGTPESTGIKGYKGGRLRASIHTKPAMLSSLEAVVKTGVHYAIYVHEGTRYMRARPFLRKGTEFARRRYTGQDIASRLDQEFIKKFKTL